MDIPFVKNRKQRWSRLYQLLEKAKGDKLSSFTKTDLLELSVLYRQTSSDLAFAKSHGLPDDVIQLLNDLVSRAYHYIYRSEKTSVNYLINFFRSEFPQIVRENWIVMLVSFGILTLGWAIGFFGYLIGPDAITHLLHGNIIAEIIKRYDTNTWFNDPLVARPYISSAIMTNNIQVAIMAFAGGMLLSTLTVYSLFFNGFLLGALSGAFWTKGIFWSFWAMILPHGVIELTAIFVAAAGGLQLTRLILFPGELSRQDALRVHGTAAIKILAGSVMMLVVAGLIEGFLSTTSTKVIPELYRLCFAGLTAIGLFWYFKPYHKRRKEKAS